MRGKCLPGILDTRSLFSIITNVVILFISITNLVIIVIVILITNTIIIVYYQYKSLYKIPDPFFYPMFIGFLILLQSRFTYVQSSCLLFVVLCTIFNKTIEANVLVTIIMAETMNNSLGSLMSFWSSGSVQRTSEHSRKEKGARQ